MNIRRPLDAPLLAVLLGLSAARASAQADVRGELLLGELNCLACHDAPEAARARLAPQRGPKLGVSGLRIAPQWLRSFLAEPQHRKPGTTMPDMLAQLPGPEKDAAVEALVHYLVSLRPARPPVTEVNRDEMARGRALYHRVGCVACHAPMDPPGPMTADDRVMAEMAKTTAESVRLGDLARKFAVPDLAEFLRNPLKFHPSGRMPSLKLNESEARAIAMYLLRDQVTPDAPKARGLKFEYFGKVLENLGQFDAEKPEETGLAESVGLEPSKSSENFSLRFRGTLTVPSDGDYTFFTRSDDGSWLLIDGRIVVDNPGMHAAEERSGKITLKAGEHAFACCFFQGASESELIASWQAPGLPKQEIPPSAFTYGEAEMRPLGSEEFTPDKAKAAKGRELFASLNCVICHQQAGLSGVMSLKPLAELDAKREGGCLSANPAPGLPRYALADADRASLAGALAGAAGWTKPLAPAERIERTMLALDCTACHARGGRGGPQAFRRGYFVAVDGAAGEADRFPPPLDGLGAKHDAAWIANALLQTQATRPNLATRMPLYGEELVKELPAAFVAADAPAAK